MKRECVKVYFIIIALVYVHAFKNEFNIFNSDVILSSLTTTTTPMVLTCLLQI